MKSTALVFVAPEKVALIEESLPDPSAGQVLVKTLLSGVSAGTELLMYRGLAPESMALDESISTLQSSCQFPFKYGYSCVGEVEQIGQNVPEEWLGKRVFSFHPHQSAFLASPNELIPLPDWVDSEHAVFLPNLETAINLVMDARPIIGEKVVIFGLGVVGLLTSTLMANFPLDSLIAFDHYPLRRSKAAETGRIRAFDPAGIETAEKMREWLHGQGVPQGADLALELSGSPQALNLALGAVGFGGRVVIGSWYGKKQAALELGGFFHRSRIQMISSQVSTIAPELSGRWDKNRRFASVLNWLPRLPLPSWITHKYPIDQADQAYQQLAAKPQETIQVVLTY